MSLVRIDFNAHLKEIVSFVVLLLTVALAWKALTLGATTNKLTDKKTVTGQVSSACATTETT